MRYTITEEALHSTFPIHTTEDTAEEVATLLRAGETLPLETTTELLESFNNE